MLAVFNKHNIPSEIQLLIFEYLKMKEEFEQVIYTLDIGIHKKRVIYNTTKSILGRDIRRITHAEDIYHPSYHTTNIKTPIIIQLSNTYSYEPVAWPSLESKYDPETKCSYCYGRIKLSEKKCIKCKLTRIEAKQLDSQSYQHDL